MWNELRVHYLVLTCCSICKLINSFARTKLNKELGKTFNYLVSFQTDLSFVTCNQTKQNLFEAGMCNEVREYVDVAFSHEW